MIRVVALVVVLVIGAVVDDAKCEPSTLQAILNSEYYLGSGQGQSSNLGDFKNKEHALSEEENKIVQDVYSPDYYEPNIILDYRYLKTGGRGYARSDGGQILILPKRNQMPDSHNNYDTLIEYLRLKHLNEMNKYWGIDSQRASKGQGLNGYDGQDGGYSFRANAEKGWATYIR